MLGVIDMKKYNVGLIRVINFEDRELLNLHGEIIEEHYNKLNIISKAIPNQPFGIYNEETKKQAIPKIIELSKSWEDIDALIMSCAGDPALKELREILDIPIIGAGESTSLLSLRYGEKIGVLGITKETPSPYIEILGEKIIGKTYIEGVESTLDLMTEDGRHKAIDAALELKNLGAKVIALACTGMATIGLAKELEKICKIPVIDPVLAEGLITYYELIRNN